MEEFNPYIFCFRVESKETLNFKGIHWMSAKMWNFAYWHIRHI